MATRKDLLMGLSGLGMGISRMGAQIQDREQFDTKKALEEEEAIRQRELHPIQKEAVTAQAGAAKLTLSELLSTADKRKGADSANQALMAENEAAGWKLDPDDQPNLPTWKAELNAVNRFRAKEGKPAMSVDQYVMSKMEEKTTRTRESESHTSKMANDKAAREAGRFSFVQGDGEILRGNTKTGTLEGTGKAPPPKPAAKPPSPEEGLSLDTKKQIEVLSSKSAGKVAIANQLESDLIQLRAAMGLDAEGKPIPGKKPNEDLAYSYAQNMLKTMNSKEGADAVGVDEAKRAAALLDYNVADVRAGLGMKPGKFHGRDMAGFIQQVSSNVDGIKGSVDFNKKEIDRLYGRQPSATPTGGSKFKILSVED